MADFYVFDIQPTRISAASFARSGKSCAVSQYHSMAFSFDLLDQALMQICEAIHYRKTATIVTLSPELISFVNLTLPFKNKKKLEQVLPFELDNIIADEVSDILFDYIHSSKSSSSSELTIAAVKKSFLADLLSQLQNAGIDPYRIGISGQVYASLTATTLKGNVIFLDILEISITLFIFVGGSLKIVRSFTTGAPITPQDLYSPSLQQWLRQTFLASNYINIRANDYQLVCNLGEMEHDVRTSFLQGFDGGHVIDASTIFPFPSYFSSETKKALQSGALRRLACYCLPYDKKQGEFNLRTRDFHKSISIETYGRYIARIGVPISILLISFIFYYAWEYSKNRAELDSKQNEIVAIFKDAMPGVTRIVSPLQQLKVAINEKKSVYQVSKSGTNQFNVLALLTELSTRIGPDIKVTLTRLIADAELVRIFGATGDYNAVDQIKRVLEKSPLFKNVEITSANQSPQENEIRFELKAEINN